LCRPRASPFRPAGSGYGYGAGVRIDTPIGPLRLEYAFNDRRQTKFHLGIGYAG
jgi:outer membrane protein insertion porin family